MREIVANRKRIDFGTKVRLAAMTLRENGVIWAVLLGLYWSANALATWSFTRICRRRQSRGTPGLNSVALNRAIWDAWDWSAGGDEWTPSEAWKTSVVKGIMDRFLPTRAAVLEIGPGGGRWTEFLLARYDSYLGIDVSQSAIERCMARFGSKAGVSFRVGSGNDLRDAMDTSVDAIWSFDVFVHINTQDVARYLKEFGRVLRPGGVAVIHHGAVGGILGGWRSDLSNAAMLELVAQSGLEVTASFKEWACDGQIFRLDTYDDVVTVIRKPLA